LVGALKIPNFNCNPNLSQPIELPSREVVKKIFERIKPQVLGQVYPVNDLIDVFGEFIGNYFRVDVLHYPSDEVDPNDINVSAFYDPEKDEQGKIAIELVLITNSRDNHIIIDDQLLQIIVTRLADTLAHEMIHMRQSRARDFIDPNHPVLDNPNLNETQQYLGDPDEIDAYAHNIANELAEHPNPQEILSNPKSITLQHSINLWAYLTAFNKDLANPIIRKLLKKVYRHLT
jgi:hypothetical protein